MTDDNLNSLIREISLTSRTYRVFSRVSRKDCMYKISTCSKPSKAIVNELIDMFAHEPALRITENGKEVYVRYEKQSSPSCFMDMHRGYLGVYEGKSRVVYDTVEDCAVANKIEVETVVSSLRNAEKGLKSRFKFLK